MEDNESQPKRPDAHRIGELRSIEYHRRIAEKITAQPALLGPVLARLDQWGREGDYSKRWFATRWKTVLARPWPEVTAFLVEDTEQAIHLRSSSPFIGILSPDERNEIFAAVGAKYGVAPD